MLDKHYTFSIAFCPGPLLSIAPRLQQDQFRFQMLVLMQGRLLTLIFLHWLGEFLGSVCICLSMSFS